MRKNRTLEGKRLQHIELSDKHRTVRWVLVIVLLVIAAVSITIGLTSALKVPEGWQTVSGSTTELHRGDDFVFQYEYGVGDASAAAEKRQLEPLYGQALANAWKLFYNEAGDTNLSGLFKLNQNPNKELELDAGLYRALEQVVKSENRALYLAPVYAEYDRIFLSAAESIAQEYDPGQNAEQMAYVQTLASYANDPQTIQLALKGNNKVVLQVSQAYLTFAQENELRYFLDFGWMRNAFVVDYLASAIAENGFTNGYIASADGFTRNLDRRGNGYNLNLFNRRGNDIELPAVMEYTAPMSLVALRGYPMSDADSQRYYSFSNGRIVTYMIDPADGQSKVSTNNLVSYSAELTCGELALAVMPVFVADEFSEEAVNALTEQGIYSVWFTGLFLKRNQQTLELTVYEPYSVK